METLASITFAAITVSSGTLAIFIIACLIICVIIWLGAPSAKAHRKLNDELVSLKKEVEEIQQELAIREAQERRGKTHLTSLHLLALEHIQDLTGPGARGFLQVYEQMLAQEVHDIVVDTLSGGRHATSVKQVLRDFIALYVKIVMNSISLPEPAKSIEGWGVTFKRHLEMAYSAIVSLNAALTENGLDLDHAYVEETRRLAESRLLPPDILEQGQDIPAIMRLAGENPNKK